MGLRRLNHDIGARRLYRWIATAFYRVGALMGAIVAASTAINGTQEAETAFDRNATIPANALEAGSIVRIRAQGIHTSTTGAETHSLILKIGATTVYTAAAIDPANNDIFVIDLEVCIRTAGVAGTCVGAGSALPAGASGTGTMKAVHLASTAIDTTVDNVVAVFVDRQAAATDGDSMRLDHLSVEVL